MPSSRYSHIELVLRILHICQPMKLLDIGVGFGKYGFLAREYLELWDGRQQYDAQRWRRQIDGIEAFAPYVTPAVKFVYDTVYVAPAQDIIDDIEEYDLTLILATLEHMSQTDGQRVLRGLNSKALFIGVPYPHTEQGPVFDNTFEVHRCGWTPSTLAQYFPDGIYWTHNNWLCVFAGESHQQRAVSTMIDQQPRCTRLPAIAMELDHAY